ncbi:MAG: transcriptional repressor LexA [Anaerolineales bacterium]
MFPLLLIGVMGMPRKRKKGLSERQKKILEVLESFQDQNGYPPSIREICSEASISSTSVVNYYLEQLEEMGYIERDRRISRGVRLLKPLENASQSISTQMRKAAEAVSEMLQIPVLGRIVAGELMPVPSSDFSYYDYESKIEIPQSQLPAREKGKDLFALEVQGDSMIDAMVNDGDIVIMKPANDARNGEMVAIWISENNETTLKYFFRENGQVRLQPANPTMEPIIIKDPSTLEVKGKVIMVIRQVSGLPS